MSNYNNRLKFVIFMLAARTIIVIYALRQMWNIYIYKDNLFVTDNMVLINKNFKSVALAELFQLKCLKKRWISENILIFVCILMCCDVKRCSNLYCIITIQSLVFKLVCLYTVTLTISLMMICSIAWPWPCTVAVKPIKDNL